MKLLLAILLTVLLANPAIMTQEKSYLNLSLNDCVNLAKENSKQKQIAETKLEVSKSHLKASRIWQMAKS